MAQYGNYSCGHNMHSRFPVFLLALFWCAGLFLGFVCAANSSPVILSMMRMALYARVSIVGGLFAVVFPLITTLVVVFTSARFWVLPVAFFKAYCFSYIIGCFFALFGSASWLVLILLMFSELVLITPLMWLWIRALINSRSVKIDFVCVAIFSVSVFLIDKIAISPFLAKVF